jgi:hypothetical protein
MAFIGRIACVSGIFAGPLNPQAINRPWRLLFTSGLVAAVLVGSAVPT